MLNQVAANIKRLPRGMERSTPAREGLRGFAVPRRAGSILLYSVGALILAIAASFVFNFMDHDTEFAIAVTGSLIGGFLGAMLAASVIVDVYSPSDERDKE